MDKIKPVASSDLLPRIVSALILAPLVLGAVWLGGLSFQIMIAVAVILMAYEWARLTCAPHWRIDALIIGGTALAAMLLIIWAADRANDTERQLLLAGGGILAGMGLAACLGWLRGRELRWRLLGVPYIALGPAAMVWMRAFGDIGLTLIIWLLLVVWAMDIGAYFAGRAIGGPKLAPRASPNKTWAGLIGGMVSAAIVGGAGAVMFGKPVLQVAGISAVIGAWSQAGDIAESMVKRRFGVKDMSNLIPGHGGVLDRVDGLLFAAPLMAILLWLTLGSI